MIMKNIVTVVALVFLVSQCANSLPVTGAESSKSNAVSSEGTATIEGDILLLPRPNGRSSRAVYSSHELIWTGGVIPYIVNACIDAQLRASILFAMGRWENSTCLKFVERSG